jgi:hypothetical protein
MKFPSSNDTVLTATHLLTGKQIPQGEHDEKFCSCKIMNHSTHRECFLTPGELGNLGEAPPLAQSPQLAQVYENNQLG